MRLRVAMIGHAFMGRAHSQAWVSAPRFFDLPTTPELALVVGRDADATAGTARRFGWAESGTDWRAAIERDDIDLIDICTPGDTHAEIAIAALGAGKHVLCEKPLANTVAEAEAMTRAAVDAAAQGIHAMCGFTYRSTPALALARRLVDEGRLGEIRHVRAQYLQDWLTDPDAPHSWRLDAAKAGSGALGDIAAHSIDTAQWLSGQAVTHVSGRLATFVDSRPLAGERTGLGGSGDASAARGAVTVDDAAAFTARFDGGAFGTFEATRAALGRRNANRIELDGTRGSVYFDFEESNVLHYFDGTDEPHVRGFRRILVTEPEHPYAGAWWPPGHGLGYEHGFTHQVVDLVRALAAGEAPRPSFADALQVQRVLDAVARSAADHSRETAVSG